jgi:hypothetical protein
MPVTLKHPCPKLTLLQHKGVAYKWQKEKQLDPHLLENVNAMKEQCMPLMLLSLGTNQVDERETTEEDHQ